MSGPLQVVPDIDDQVNHPEHLQEVNYLLGFLFRFIPKSHLYEKMTNETIIFLFGLHFESSAAKMYGVKQGNVSSIDKTM